MPTYQLFGLRVASEFLLPFQPDPRGEPDVTVRPAGLPDTYPGTKPCNRRCAAAPGIVFHSDCKDTRLLIRDGSEILVDTLRPDCPELTTRLLGIGMSSILLQRGALQLHASAVATADRAVVLAGNRGEGKSVLAAHLRSKGWVGLADDRTVIEHRNGSSPLVHPSHPLFRLSLEDLDGHTASKSLRFDPQLGKELLHMGESFSPRSFQLGAIYLLEQGEPAPDCRPLPPASEGLARLFNLTGRKQIIEGLGLTATVMQAFLAVISEVPVRILRRAPGRTPVEQVAAVLEADLHHAGWTLPEEPVSSPRDVEQPQALPLGADSMLRRDQ